MRAEVYHYTKGSSRHYLPQPGRDFFMHSLDVQLDFKDIVLLKPEDFGYTYDTECQLESETTLQNLKQQ